MLGTLKRLAVVAPVALLLLALGAHPAYADQTVIDSVDASPNTATVGDTVTFTDVITLSGTTPPTGDVTFRMYPSDDCTGTPLFNGSATLVTNGGTSTSTATFTSAPWVAVEGEYHWWISYDGAGGQDPVDDDCDETAQRVVVSPSAVKATPTLSGEVSPTEAVEGEEFDITDVATLTGGSNATGTILFGLFDNDSCDGDPVLEGEAPITGGTTATFEDTVVADAPGTYWFALIYEGDANNEEAQSPCNEATQRLLIRAAPFEGPDQEPGPDTPVMSPGPGGDGGGADPTVTDNGGEVLPVTGPAPISRIAQGALAILMIGLAAIIMGTSPRTRW